MLLDNISVLMERRGITNLRVLSQGSGIPYTTLDGLYKKGCDNVKLSTLNKLCDYFNVSLDYLISGKSCSLTNHEEEVITAYRSLGTSERRIIDQALKINCESEETQKKKRA